MPDFDEDQRDAAMAPPGNESRRECDLILQGGVTSGLVYPTVITTLSDKYRFRQIGGTSAGAIGAALAGAAEFRRQESTRQDCKAGFDLIGKIPDDLGPRLQQLFQPVATLQRLHGIVIELANALPSLWSTGTNRSSTRAVIRVARVVLSHFSSWLWIALAVAATLCLSLTAWSVYGSGGPWNWPVPVSVNLILACTAVFLLVALLLIGGIIKHLYTDIAKHLPNNDFGLSTGLKSPENDQAALTDWLCNTLNNAAGIGPLNSAGPLLIKHLEQHCISLVCMTTDLGSGRPYKLPFTAAVHYFRLEDFGKLFPGDVIDYLKTWAEEQSRSEEEKRGGFFQLAYGKDMPVVVAVRLSLSFPGLLSSVPLYRRVKQPNTENQVRFERTLFSDGGISSNFPIHLFDVWLPSRPTFGVSLVPRRQGDARVYLPEQPLTMQDVPIRPLTAIFPFLSAILDTARNWQDNLQSLAPGYSERIVRIRLDPEKEGGLNFAMDEKVIEDLKAAGREAGNALIERYQAPADSNAPEFFDEHRYRRVLSLMPAVDDALITLATRFYDPAITGTSYHQVLTEHKSLTYPRCAPWRRDVLLPFVQALVGLGKAAPKDPSKKPRCGSPESDATIARVDNAQSVAYRRPLSERGASVRLVVTPSDETGLPIHTPVAPL